MHIITMSGGITQLVAIGAQDEYLVGDPQVSFFRSVFKRHTNFSQMLKRQVIQGSASANNMSIVRFEKGGDMLSYVYLVEKSGSTIQQFDENKIDKVELYVGGQMIDTQDTTFSQTIWPEFFCNNESLVKQNTPTYAYPLHFSHCDNFSSALPLVALQYHDVEIRIYWSSSVSNSFECYANYIFLDEMERKWFANNPIDLLVTQTQKELASNKQTQTFSYSHPVKAIVCSANNPTSAADPKAATIKIQYNGTEIGEPKEITPHFNEIPAYYHTFNGDTSGVASSKFMIPYCLNVSSMQPSGSLNFSRLDSAVFTTSSGVFDTDLYAVNYNVLHIEGGMGGLLYAS